MDNPGDGSHPSKTKKTKTKDGAEKVRKRSPGRPRVKPEPARQDPPVLTSYFGQSVPVAASHPIPTMAEGKVNPAMVAHLAATSSGTTQHVPVTAPLIIKTELPSSLQGRMAATLPPKKSPSRMVGLAEEEKPGVVSKVAAEEKGSERTTLSPGLLAYVQQQQLELQRRQRESELKQQQQDRMTQEYQRISPQSQQQRRTPPPARSPVHVQRVGDASTRASPGQVILRPVPPATSDYGGLLRQQLLQRSAPLSVVGAQEAHQIFSAYKAAGDVPYSEAGHVTTLAQGVSQIRPPVPGEMMGTGAGGEIRRIGSFLDPHQAHYGERLSPVPPHQIHVSTIRRTPSPAHQRVSPQPPSLSPAMRTSPVPPQEGGAPVNLSVHDSVALHRSEPGAVQYVTATSGLTRGPQGGVGAHIMAQQRQTGRDASSMVSFTQEQGEILRQVLEPRVSPGGLVQRQSPSPSRHSDRGPSPQRLASPDQRRYSPGPAGGASKSSYSPGQRSAAPSTQGGLLTTVERRHRTPSPKPQHRHKESMGGVPVRPQVQQPSSISTSLPSNIGPIRQPMVDLVRLPIPQVTDIKNLPAFSASAISQLTAASARQVAPAQPNHEYVRVVPSNQKETVMSTQQERVPLSQIQHQVNPFTFPTQPPTSISLGQHAFNQYEIKQEMDIKQEAEPVKREPRERFKKSESPDDMPRLTPIRTLKPEDQENKDVDMVTMQAPFNKRLLNIANLPTSSIYRSTYRSHTFAINRAKVGVITNTAKSLDILRQNLQKCINKEIDQIIQSYLEKFFKPGIENIKVNNGEGAVSEEHVQAVCRQILEEAKKMYSTDQGMTPSREIPDNVSESGSTGSRRAARKRRPSDTDSDKGPYAIPRPKVPKKGRPPFAQVTGRTTPSKTVKSGDFIKREGPKWDTDRLKPESKFVMGARANKALGLGATRGRIYIKHPDVFKYSGDQDDKTWLYENHHMPATGGKAYMLLLEDIQDLAKEEEYRDNPNVFTENLSGFTIPDWMMAKVKIQMAALRTDVSKVKSRSTTPVESEESRREEQPSDSEVKLPFTSFSSPKEKERSPSAETEIDFLTTEDNENDNDNASNLSPFNITGGFEEGTSRSPSDVDPMDDDGGTPLSGHFEYNK